MSLVFREDYTLGKCDLKDVHAESSGYGLPFARWQAFHIDRHSADLCEGCKQIWATSWTDNGGTVQTIKRNNMIVGKGNR
jgi:hypothetical protein